MERGTADRLCPGAAEDRESWQSGVERDAEAAAHTDNLVPVARTSRSGLRRDVGLLRQYAAVLGGELTGTRADELLTDVGSRRVASADLDALCRAGAGRRRSAAGHGFTGRSRGASAGWSQQDQQQDLRPSCQRPGSQMIAGR